VFLRNAINAPFTNTPECADMSLARAKRGAASLRFMKRAAEYC
jgi:hypothetical protein